MAHYRGRVLVRVAAGGGREIDSAGDGFFLAQAPSAAVGSATRTWA